MKDDGLAVLDDQKANVAGAALLEKLMRMALEEKQAKALLSIEDTPALLRGEAGTIVTREADGLEVGE